MTPELGSGPRCPIVLFYVDQGRETRVSGKFLNLQEIAFAHMTA
jgi:hypothetical protein